MTGRSAQRKVSVCLPVYQGKAYIEETNSHDIDQAGAGLGPTTFEPMAAKERPSQRYRDLVRYECRCDAIYGLMWTEVVRRTRLHGAFEGSDWVLLAEMGLRGRFRRINFAA
jgi:hypothetical protein